MTRARELETVSQLTWVCGTVPKQERACDKGEGKNCLLKVVSDLHACAVAHTCLHQYTRILKCLQFIYLDIFLNFKMYVRMCIYVSVYPCM